VGPLGTLAALLVLDLGGTVIDYAVMVSGASLATVFGSLFWGLVLDATIDRKVLLTLSYLGISASFLVMFSSATVSGVALAYIILSFFQSSVGPVSNIMIMNISPRSEWPTAFGKYNSLSSVGVIAGYVFSSFWAAFARLDLLLLVFSAVSFGASLYWTLSLKGVHPMPIERVAYTLNRQSFVNRFLSTLSVFLRIPRLNDFRRFRKLLASPMTRQAPLLYLSLFIFNIASGVYNTALNPSLVSRSLTKSEVFAVNMVAMAVQAYSMQRSGRIPPGRLVSSAKTGLTLRIAGYTVTAVAMALLTKLPLAVAVGLAFSLAGGYAYSLFYVSSTSLVFDTLQGGRQGGMLGVISALSGGGAFIGSIVSGYLAFYTGYPVTDAVAAFILLFALYTFAFAYLEHESSPRT